MNTAIKCVPYVGVRMPKITSPSGMADVEVAMKLLEKLESGPNRAPILFRMYGEDTSRENVQTHGRFGIPGCSIVGNVRDIPPACRCKTNPPHLFGYGAKVSRES